MTGREEALRDAAARCMRAHESHAAAAAGIVGRPDMQRHALDYAAGMKWIAEGLIAKADAVRGARPAAERAA